MMIKVTNLTKQFSAHTAVDDISFKIQRGEVVGFLGPNGAGKTTTMRMLTGFLHPTRGAVEIAGVNVLKDSIEARRHIGYMPENCPLYTEMRVDEYLAFRARIKGVPRKKLRNRLNTVKEQCGLTETGRRIIGQLSKGYRQRIGLADSLLHEPDLLILDEPTIGLDPAQIRETRQLIHQLAEHHTLLLSSHILPEVEMTCSRILIFNEGKIVISDSPNGLQKRLIGDSLVRTEIQSEPEIKAILKNIDPSNTITHKPLGDGWSRYQIHSSSPDIRAQVFDCVVSNGWKLRELHLESRSLEDIFVAIIRDHKLKETHL